MSAHIDEYIFEILMKDLVGHDKQPSAFLVYLYLWYETHGKKRNLVDMSLQELAACTGLSKSSVQSAIKVLKRRRLIEVRLETRTSIPQYRLLKTWNNS